MDKTRIENRTHLILGRIISIKKSLRRGEKDPVDLHELGICYYHLGNQRQATAYLDSLGVYYIKEGDKVWARKALTKALSQAPDNPDILNHLKYLLH